MQHISPLMVQWCEIKAKYPDALLLFRVGDFYEAYDDDAKDACKILTLRSHILPNPICRCAAFRFTLSIVICRVW